jgi:hypothetical protein
VAVSKNCSVCGRFFRPKTSAKACSLACRRAHWLRYQRDYSTEHVTQRNRNKQRYCERYPERVRTSKRNYVAKHPDRRRVFYEKYKTDPKWVKSTLDRAWRRRIRRKYGDAASDPEFVEMLALLRRFTVEALKGGRGFVV